MDFKRKKLRLLPRHKDGTFKKLKKDKKQKKQLALGTVPETPSPWDRFNQAETKGNLNNSLMKALGDFVAGGIIGPFMGATFGKAAPLAGMALSFGGHYLGDRSNLMRIAGVSAMAHGIAKAKEYREHPEYTIKDRLKNCKDEWLYAFMLKSYQKEEKKPDQNIAEITSQQEFDRHLSGSSESPESEIYDPKPLAPEEKEPVDGTDAEPDSAEVWFDPTGSLLGYDLGFDPADDTPDFTNY